MVAANGNMFVARVEKTHMVVATFMVVSMVVGWIVAELGGKEVVVKMKLYTMASKFSKEGTMEIVVGKSTLMLVELVIPLVHS